MVNAERINVTLCGGAPWGFRLAGGGALPLTINKIRKKSKAHVQGLQEGDAVISINGTPVHDKTQDEALELVENANDNLALEIFRGDIDELSRAKPKKPIQIGGGGADNFLTLSATVGDITEHGYTGMVPKQGDASSQLMMTSSVDDMTFETSGTEFDNASGLIASFGDLSESSFNSALEEPSVGFTLSATVDDMTSSSNNNMIDSITAELGDMTSSSLISSSHVEGLQASSALSPAMQLRSPNRLSPNVLGGNSSPKPFSPVAFSPRPSNSLSPQPPPTVRPKPSTPQQQKSVSPRSRVAIPPPPVSPKPSHVSTTSSATFDDGQTRREVIREQHVQERDNGYGMTVTQKETTKSSNTQRTPFVKSQASAFNIPQQQASTATTTRTEKTSSVVKSVGNSMNGPVPFSGPAVTSSLMQQQQQQQMSSSSGNMVRKNNSSPAAPVFRPTKFVPGQGRKVIPGLYTPTSPQVEVHVHAMYADGKENVQPAQPLFQVKNIVSEKSKSRGRETWTPNVWLPGQHPGDGRQTQHQRPASVAADDFSPYTSFPVPIVQPGQSLVEKAKRNLKQSQHQRQRQQTYEEEDQYEDVDAREYQKSDMHKLHVFAPPVEIQNMVDSGYHESPYYELYPNDGGHHNMYDYEDGPSSPDSTARRNKKLYADSAFYSTPGMSYPTMGEQIKLCKKIAQSLTSQANRRARGAKMFMKRKRKSTKWIHEGQSEWSSSAGDVANIHDLDSELSPEEGGNKPLFYFKIPNLKKRISSRDRKMALTQDQFETLRLQSSKCEHKNVSPNTCFDLVADLKASKGRGGRMFEKRKNRSEKYVVDENNARRSTPKNKLEQVLNQPIRQDTSPWNAAIRHGGNVDAAFSHLSEMERNQKLNHILKYSDARKQPATPMPGSVTPTEPRFSQTSLKSDSTAFMMKGKDFNRFAKGWSGGGEYPVAEKLLHVAPPAKPTSRSRSAQSALSPQYGNYNTKIKAWQQPGESPYVQSPTTPTPARRQDQWGEPKRPEMTSMSGNDRRQQGRTEQRYDTQQLNRQSESQNRPTSWQSDGYDAHSYRDEYDYHYVPVDYKFNHQSEYPNVAYRQPIIPGTDL